MRFDIRDNLVLPWWQSSGSQEFISAWAEPCNMTNSEQRILLAKYSYLCDRSYGANQWDWSAWQSDGLYSSCLQAVCWGPVGPAPSVDWLDVRFDYAYSNGLILYHWGHPALWNANAASFFDYISGKKDVWYVGFGALYMYRYCQERGAVQVEIGDTEPLKK